MTRGFSLLELILALVLFQIGLLAGAGMIHLSQAQFRRAEVTVRAVLEAEWIGDSVLSAGDMMPGVAVFPWGELKWSPVNSPVPALRMTAWSGTEADTLLTLLALPPFHAGLFGPTPSPSSAPPSTSPEPD